MQKAVDVKRIFFTRHFGGEVLFEARRVPASAKNAAAFPADRSRFASRPLHIGKCPLMIDFPAAAAYLWSAGIFSSLLNWILTFSRRILNPDPSGTVPGVFRSPVRPKQPPTGLMSG